MRNFPNKIDCTLDCYGRVFYNDELLSEYLNRVFTHTELYDIATNASLQVYRSWPKRHIVTYIVDSFYSFLKY